MKGNLSIVLLLSIPTLFANKVVLASEQQGVQCPSGYSAEVSNSNRTLKCSKNKTYTLTAICPPQSAPMDAKGEDRCLPLVSGSVRPSIMPPLPTLPGFPPTSCFRRVVIANAADNFVCQGKEYVFPQGAIYNPLHKPANGVQCPSSYDGDRQGSNGIRCLKKDGSEKNSSCDIGWTRQNDQRGNEDRCLGLNNGPTIPDGYTKILFDAERARGDISWRLDIKSGRDKWQKYKFAYPASSN